MLLGLRLPLLWLLWQRRLLLLRLLGWLLGWWWLGLPLLIGQLLLPRSLLWRLLPHLWLRLKLRLLAQGSLVLASHHRLAPCLLHGPSTRHLQVCRHLPPCLCRARHEGLLHTSCGLKLHGRRVVWRAKQ